MAFNFLIFIAYEVYKKFELFFINLAAYTFPFAFYNFAYAYL